MNVPNVPNELHLHERIEQSIDQLTGYLARSAFKKHNCDACHSQLVRDVPLEVTSLHLEPKEVVFHSWEAQESLGSFCGVLNRGRLIFLSGTAPLTKIICHLYREVIRNDDSRRALFGSTNSRKRSSFSPYGWEKTARR